ncbi:unnamed protein product, partial [Meganyctiphanes norvegica]
MGAGFSTTQVVSLVQSITVTIQVVAKHGPQWIEAIWGSKKPIEDGCSSRRQQDQQQIQRMIHELQQYENRIDDLMKNQAELKKTIETLMCLKNQIINSVDSREGDKATNRIRVEIDVPQNLEDNEEIIRNFWKTLSEIEDKSTLSVSSNIREEGCSKLDGEFHWNEHDSSGGQGSMENKLSEALSGIQECNICAEKYNHSDRLPCVLTICGHTFCKQCIVRMSHRIHEHEGTEFEWSYDSLRCPECRKESELDIDNLTPNVWLVQLLNSKSSDTKTEEEQCAHESVNRSDGATATYPTVKTNEDSNDYDDDEDDDIKSMKLIQRLTEEDKSWEYALQLDKE